MAFQPIISISFCYRFFVTREAPARLESMASDIQSYLEARFKDDQDIKIKELTHCTVLFYYDKQQLDKNVEQMAKHRDNRYRADGTLVLNKNSQEARTPTCILTVGDSRSLDFGLFTGTKKLEGSTEISFDLDHKTLFVLHPHDEVPRVRRLFGKNCKPSFYKHGVKFGKGKKLSIAFVFRSVTDLVEVDNYGYLMHPENSTFNETHMSKMKEYLNGEKKKENEGLLKGLFRRIKKQYFRDGRNEYEQSC